MTSSSALNSQVLTRSRTLLFLSFRDTRSSSTYPPRLSRSKGKQRQEDDVEHEALLSGGHDTMIDMEESSALPPRWVDFSEEVDVLVEQIKPKMVQLDRLTAKHVLPGFTDRTSEERQIEALTIEITKGFRKCQLLIRKIADCGLEMEAYINQFKSTKSENKQPRYASRDVTLAKNVQIALATKVQSLSATFQKRQRLYLQQLKGFENGPRTEQQAMFTIEDDEDRSAAQSPSAFRDIMGQQQQQQQQRVVIHRSDQDDIEQRDKEIAGIAQSISELADMFKDLGNLVLDQGTLLDRIDYNVEQMSTDVRGAVQELKVATEYQKRSGKCRAILLLILLIFGAVLVLVYKPRHVSEPNKSSPTSDSTSPSASTQHGARSTTSAGFFHLDPAISSNAMSRRLRRRGRWKTD